MLFTIWEIIDIVLMCAVLGFVFKDYFQKPVDTSKSYDPIKAFTQKQDSSFWLAVLIVAPGIVFHEFGHKFVALSFGATATFQAAYIFLIIALVLKLANSPFLFFVPAYVAWSGFVTEPQSMLIALAGPAVNFLFWLVSHMALKLNKVPKKYIPVVVLTRKLNGFLAIFNMIPIPGFDGWHVFSSLFHIFF